MLKKLTYFCWEMLAYSNVGVARRRSWPFFTSLSTPMRSHERSAPHPRNPIGRLRKRVAGRGDAAARHSFSVRYVCVCVSTTATQAASRVPEGVGGVRRGGGGWRLAVSTPIDLPTPACSPKRDVQNVGRVRTCVPLAVANARARACPL